MVKEIEKVGKFAIEDEKKVTLRVEDINKIAAKYVIKMYITYYDDDKCGGHDIFVTRTIAFERDEIERMAKAIEEELKSTIERLKELITELLAKGWKVELEELEDHDC